MGNGVRADKGRICKTVILIRDTREQEDQEWHPATSGRTIEETRLGECETSKNEKQIIIDV